MGGAIAPPGCHVPTPGQPADTAVSSSPKVRATAVVHPWRSAILLAACDKTDRWNKWYEGAIPQAEQLFALYLKERAKAEEEGRE